jgi:hypothetical protein
LDWLTVIIVLALLATIGSLVVGLFLMQRGGSLDEHYGERFMWFRVAFQGVAVLLLLLALLLR